MSRDIHISYCLTASSVPVDIPVRAPYFLFGTQSTSMRFWSMPEWKRIGLEHLTELGVGDPIYFIGWDMMGSLGSEIRLFEEHFAEIDFDPDLKSWFLAHLIYCYRLLISIAPPDSIPQLIIG